MYTLHFVRVDPFWKIVAFPHHIIVYNRRGLCEKAQIVNYRKLFSSTLMLGTIINAVAIISGSLLGLLFNKGISDNYREILLSGIGLSIVLIGIKSALASESLMVVLFSMIIGAVIGEFINIENKLKTSGRFLERKVSKKSAGSHSISHGFVSASLIFCVGSMAIVGALESGLTGNHQTLLAKSLIDGIMSIVLTSALGIGVIFSSVAVFIYQGAITLAAFSMRNFLVPETIAQMTSVGGLLILAIGLNMLKITEIRVGNILPAIFLPLLYYVFITLIS